MTKRKREKRKKKQGIQEGYLATVFINVVQAFVIRWMSNRQILKFEARTIIYIMSKLMHGVYGNKTRRKKKVKMTD